MLRWYLLQTKPSREALAEQHLRRQGFEVYYPRLRQGLPWGATGAERITPLFPRYLFLGLDHEHQSLGPVHSTLGVARIVRFGNHYTPVPERVIDELQARADPDTGLHALKSRSITEGSRVRVVAGALYGLEGAFMCRAGADRVVVLLNLLGHEAAVQLPSNYVRPGVRL